MKYKTTSILFIITVMSMLIGCAEPQLTNEQVKHKLIEANSNLNTYSADIEMDMTMSVQGTDETGEVNMKITGVVDVNQPEKKLALNGKMTMDMEDAPAEQAALLENGLDMNVYIVDGYAYTQTMGTWMKIESNDQMWDQQNQINHYLEYLDSGSVDLKEDQTINGKNYYVVELKPNMQEVLEYALNQQSQGLNLDLKDLNWEDIIREYTSTVYVNKDTFIIEKSEEKILLVMTSENMGQMAESMEGEIHMNIDSQVSIININEPVEITLPKAAKDAMDVAQLQQQMENMNAQPLQ